MVIQETYGMRSGSRTLREREIKTVQVYTLYSLPTLRKSKNIKKRKIFHSGAGEALEFMMSVRNLVGWTDKRN